MYTIDVDFEVYKQLTVRRATEAVSYNDVIRELLGLRNQKPAPASPPETFSQGDWVVKNVRFSAGTEFRAMYKGKMETGRVEGGLLVLSNGKRFDTPSAAAVSITKNMVNGWRFWECKLPGKTTWQSMDSLRR